MQEVSDIQAIRLILKGSEKGCLQIVQRYQHYVYTIVLRIVKNTEDAEEVAQDVFIKAFKSLKNFQGKSKFSTWLYSIAYTTAISHLRKMANKKALYNNAEPQERDAVDNSLGQFVALQNEERKQYIRQVVQQLPGDEGTVISLFYLNEFSLKEIANTMNITVNNAKVKLHRARKSMLKGLQTLLQQEAKELL